MSLRQLQLKQVVLLLNYRLFLCQLGLLVPDLLHNVIQFVGVLSLLRLLVRVASNGCVGVVIKVNVGSCKLKWVVNIIVAIRTVISRLKSFTGWLLGRVVVLRRLWLHN